MENIEIVLILYRDSTVLFAVPVNIETAMVLFTVPVNIEMVLVLLTVLDNIVMTLVVFKRKCKQSFYLVNNGILSAP